MLSCPQNYHPVLMPAHHKISPKRARLEAESFYKKMSKRHSIREFCETSVNENIIKTAIRTAARAPSGANQQPWHFVAIKDAEMKREIREAAEAE